MKTREHVIEAVLVVFAISFALSNVAHTEEKQLARGDTLYGLLQDCRVTKPGSDMELMNWVGCRSYISGLRDVLIANGNMVREDGAKALSICNVPSAPPVEAYIQVVVNWAEQHPEFYGKHKAWAMFALTDKWPCP